MYEEYIQQGLTIHKGLLALPDSIDDQGVEISLVECIELTGIDRSTWLAHMKRWRETCRKDRDGRWHISTDNDSDLPIRTVGDEDGTMVDGQRNPIAAGKQAD